jgi:hypothetical protein
MNEAEGTRTNSVRNKNFPISSSQKTFKIFILRLALSF